VNVAERERAMVDALAVTDLHHPRQVTQVQLAQAKLSCLVCALAVLDSWLPRVLASVPSSVSNLTVPEGFWVLGARELDSSVVCGLA
jgi:hypothetical protein